MPDHTILVSSAALACGFVAYSLWRARATPRITLPPSPKSYPIIGHLLSMPSEYEHLGYIKLGEQLGSRIFSLTVFGTTIVVLNNAEDATNLLDKRSVVYSDRPSTPMVVEPSLVDWQNFGSLIGYNDRWRKYRRLLNPWLHKNAVNNFHSSQLEAARLFLQRLLEKHHECDSSEMLTDEVYRTVASTVLRSVYGYDLKSLDDPFLVGVRIAVDNLGKACLPSNFLVNVIPALVHVPEFFPGMKWKQTAREWRQQKEEVTQATYRWAKERHVEGSADQTIIGAMITQASKLGLSAEETDDYVQEIAITLLSGGTDTTVNTLVGFFLAMMLFPEVKKKAQKEIDDVIGIDGLPNLEDQPQLPYIDRVVQEVLRWLPVTPIGVPHVCFQDDVYQGYNIPKGAVMMGNVWAMTRDSNVYKNPEIFDPDRFLDPAVPPSPVFGWGRRQCPGRHFADASLFIVIASFLATFDIDMAKDKDGWDIIPSGKMANSLVIHPEPFKYKITPRSEAHKELIRTSI